MWARIYQMCPQVQIRTLIDKAVGQGSTSLTADTIMNVHNKFRIPLQKYIGKRKMMFEGFSSI